MPQDTGFDSNEFVRGGIEELRRHLLDFSTRNRLLSFKHPERGTDFIRAVDELPGEIYQRLNGGRMRFKPLPDDPLNPPDEASSAFRRALANLRDTDEDYRKALDVASKGPSFEVERTLRDKVRATLGLEPLLRKGKLDAVAFAKACGIDPSYDLPEPDSDKKAGHTDRFIQTLFTQDDLDRRGRKLYERYQDHLQEKGINVLYAAFGFLEWYEDDNSDTFHHAPLLLQQLNMARKTEQGRIGVELSGESDPEVNTTLCEYLKKDFHIVLPAFTTPAEADTYRLDGTPRSPSDDATALESWLNSVAESIKGKRRWRVRRFVTIGTFPFSRIGLFKDLEASTWQDDELIAHELVARLLGGRGRYEGETGESGSEDYPLDAPKFADKVPSTILDADSSQHSAIVDALAGHSFVIQGPPGTGKSQTIADIIAAALDGGKRVLFVAEKSAALNVVASRLRHWGFGPFLLELHSDRARKANVIASLKERLELPQTALPAGLARKIEQRRASRDKLARYVGLMAKPVGRLGRPLQQLMWFANRHEAQLAGALPVGFEKMTVPKANDLDEQALEGIRHELDLYASARNHVLKSCGSVARQPWRGVTETNPFSLDDILERARHALAAFRDLAEQLRQLAEGKLALPDNETALAAWLRDAARMPVMLSDHRLMSIALDFPASLKEIGDLLDLWQSLSQKFTALFVDVDAVETRTLASLLKECEALGVALNYRAIDAAAQASAAECAGLEECLACMRRLCRPIGQEWNGSTEDGLALTEAYTALRTTSVEALSIRTEGLRAESSDVAIAQARRKAVGLRTREASLAEHFDLGRARRDYAPETLHQLSDALTDGGILSLVTPQGRRATKAHKRLRGGECKIERANRALDLRKVAEHLSEVRAFAEDRQLHTLLGSTFCGHETDFDLIGETIRYLRHVSAAMARAAGLQAAREVFVQGEAHVLAALSHEIPEQALDCLRDEFRKADASGQTLDERLARARERTSRLQALRASARDAGLTQEGTVPADRRPGGHWVVVGELERMRAVAASLEQLRPILGESFDVVRADTSLLRAALTNASAVKKCRLNDQIMDELRRADRPEHRRQELAAIGATVYRLLTAAKTAWAEFASAAAVEEEGFLEEPASQAEFSTVVARLERALEEELSLADWMSYQKARVATMATRAAAIVEAFDASDQEEERLGDAFELSLVRTLIRKQLGVDAKELAELSGTTLDDARARFASLDKEINVLEAIRIVAEVRDRHVDYGNDRGPKSEWTGAALVEHEVSKRKRHIPIRALARRAHGALLGLKPVWLMSPLTVAQYAPQLSSLFDMVIIDEASQMRPADAVGAIARAPQAIIVGDPLQLPPTDFFNAPSHDGDGFADSAADGHSSILDLAYTRLPRKRLLRWHYRSRHQSLIALSNREFYENKLVVFPSAEDGRGLGIEHVYVGGRYQIGGTNPDEAKAVVERARESIERFPDRSIGIATTNLHQRELIIEELERLTDANKRVAEYRAQWQDTLEPLFVKNLENVQGDERDVIIISTVFGPDEAGKVAQRFGPINSEAGHRRLNVLFTRAKLQLILMTSIKPTEILATPSAHKGVHVLKAFLEFAATGRVDAGVPTDKAADSDFEVHVARLLERSGYVAVPQVGVQGYRIDIGVRHSEYPYGFVAGIECDGKTYHSGITVRDRDRLRQEILEGLGWRLYRIWSTDWFAHPERETRKMVAWLDQQREQLSSVV
jgi:very-short-patch-repair endonuclease